MKIDFRTKKTEAGWQKVLDNFWMKATPKWFEWLGWVIILGAFTFLSKTQENMISRYPRAEPVALVPKHKLSLTPYGRLPIHPRAKPVELCPSGY